jgi:8-oxo-dGTP diphosphatase
MDGDKVLLGKRSIEPFKGTWDLPGGFLEDGEHPEDGLKRETLEETGFSVEPVEVLGFFMDKYVYDSPDTTLNIAFIARITGGKAKANDDIDELGWFSLAKLPENLSFKNTHDMLESLKKWYENKKT